MANPLFSTYSGGENRVTSSTMAVFERIDLALVQELLEAATGSGEELPSVTFENQVVNPGAVPDARISGRFVWWFETKTVRGGYAAEGHDRDQLRTHAQQLVGDPHARLFALTPDAVRPEWFDRLDGVPEEVQDQVLWLSFKQLAEAIYTIIAAPERLVTEQSRFLLNELIAMYEAAGLLSSDDTVVVAAKTAWGDYVRHAAYICQPDRTFREGLTHFGFYYQGAIQPKIARIRRYYPTATLSDDEASRLRTSRDPSDRSLADLIGRLLAERSRVPGDVNGVMLLSPHDDVETVTLGTAIVNDTTTAAGKPWAWTLGQRYTRLERLMSGVTHTSQL